MSRRLQAIFILGLLSAIPVRSHAETVDGVLTSIDVEQRKIVLDSGVILDLGENMSIDGLAVGQLVRATVADGTISLTAVDILEPAPSDPVVAE